MCKKCNCGKKKKTKKNDSYFFQDPVKKEDDWYNNYLDQNDDVAEQEEEEDEWEEKDEDDAEPIEDWDDLDEYEDERFSSKMDHVGETTDWWVPESERIDTTIDDLKSDMMKFVDLVSVGALKNKMWVTTSVAAKWYGVSERTVRRWIDSDKIVAVDIGVGQARYLVEIGLHSRWFNVNQ